MQKFIPITLEGILDDSIEGCQIIDFNWRYLYVNKTVAKQGHQTKKGLLGHTMMEIYPSIEKTNMFEHLRRCMENRKPQKMTNEFVYPDGNKAWFELRIEPIEQGILIFSSDISEQKKKEREILESKEKFQRILENLKDIVHIMSPTGKVLYVTPSVKQVLGYTSEEFLGSDAGKYVHPDDIKMAETKLQDILANPGKVFSPIEERIMHKDGNYRTMEVIAVNLLDDPVIGGVVITSRDISKEKEIDEAKSEFVSVASHALRTPLGISKWYIEAMKSEIEKANSPAIVKDYIDEIYKSNERLLTLVRNLLSISRIEQGKAIDSPRLISIPDLIKQIVKNMKLIADKDAITIHVLVDQTIIEPVFITPLKLQEAIENLISNAIKYNKPHGKVMVSLSKKSAYLQLQVTDTGIGIPSDEHEKIFTKFFRSEKAIKKNTEGSGLGLYVVEKYVQDWGGKITVESQEGKGATFSLTIPLKNTDKNNSEEVIR